MTQRNLVAVNKSDIVITITLLCFILQFWNLPAYNDDINRFTNGFIRLSEQGRYFTEWYYSSLFLFNKSTPFNIYTFNLCAIAIFLFIALKSIDNRCSVYISTGIPITLIAVQPFLVENLSYHIDSIGMLFAMSACIYASAVIRKNRFITILTSALFIVSAVFSYQSSMSVYCACVILIATAMSLSTNSSDKEVVRYVINKIMSLAIAMLVYALISKIHPVSQYITDATKTLEFNDVFFHSLSSNTYKVYQRISGSLNSLQISLYVISLIYYYVVILLTTLQCKLSAIKMVILTLSPVLSMILLFTPTVFFEKTVIEARILMSFGITSSILLLPSLGNKIVKITRNVLAIILLSLAIMTASAHVSSVNFMYSYTDRMLTSIETNARIYNIHAHPIHVKFSGFDFFPGESSVNRSAFPIIRDLAKLHFGGKWLIGLFIKYHNYDIIISDDDIKNKPKFVTSTKEYNMYYGDGVFIIKFK
ncbi:glucosyltransferase domain-containing protein [Escherichia coli]|uniref:glucosyltransferase domain-containing protein n=1 Tax=Escherichia coli TaxID=562 RepID=UPI00189DC900|nr:glucosyltransferase domain-containing protein [Escherichia coli]